MYIYTTKPKLGQYFNSLISTRVQQALGEVQILIIDHAVVHLKN